MKTSLEQAREFSYKLLSDARSKNVGYDSQATRHLLSDTVTALCPTIKPYDWQVDVAEALALGLDTKYCYRWYCVWKYSALGFAVTVGRKSRQDLSGYLAAERTRGRSCTVKVCIIETMNHPEWSDWGSIISSDFRPSSRTLSYFVRTISNLP